MSNENYSLIGIYGGTFDSIHYGHLRLAEELNELLVLSKLVFIPSGSPRLRNAPVASKHHRAAMLSLAIQNNETFMLDDREMWRDGESYSVVTLREFRKEVGSECVLCFIMGSDVFLNLSKWYCWQEMFELCHIIVADRPGYLSILNNKMPSELTEELKGRQASSIDDLKESPHGFIFVAPTTLQDISATVIRESIVANQSVRYLTPEAVLEYIKTNRMYSGKEWNLKN